jgi:hypothetical protein
MRQEGIGPEDMEEAKMNKTWPIDDFWFFNMTSLMSPDIY